jgi:hypothetical protein
LRLSHILRAGLRCGDGALAADTGASICAKPAPCLVADRRLRGGPTPLAKGTASGVGIG